MKNEFSLNVISVDEVFDIPGAWENEDFRLILENCEFVDIYQVRDEELKDYAILSLQDYEPEEAAEMLLRMKLSDHLTEGQIKNLSHEMQDEREWEEYKDLSLHERFYHCASLLYEVFPRIFPEANAVFCSVEISPKTASGIKAMHNPDETLLVRMLASGMSDRSILRRFFSDKMEKAPFLEAENIMWQFEITKKNDSTFHLEFYSSGYWMGPLNNISIFTSTAFSDLE